MSETNFKKLEQKNKRREQQEADKKLEILMKMYHRLSYRKILIIAIDAGLVKPTSNDVIALDQTTTSDKAKA